MSQCALPMGVQIAQALGVPLFALVVAMFGAWIAWHQMVIARVKLQHDLYDRRYRVFDAARRFLAEIVVHRNTTDEALRAFTIGTGDAAFLFDNGTSAYLEELRRRAATLQVLNRETDSMPVGQQRTNASNKISEHFTWFVQQLDGLVDRFKPYLKLEKCRGRSS